MSFVSNKSIVKGVVAAVFGAALISTQVGSASATSAPGVLYHVNLAVPQGVAISPNGDKYVSDYGNNRVLKLDYSDHKAVVVAGNGTAGFKGDGGKATKAELNQPEGIAFDSAGSLYIADFGNNRVRKVATNGVITTIAGNGSYPSTGANGKATSVSVASPSDVAVDASGNVYESEGANTQGGLVRKIDKSGNISTYAGKQNLPMELDEKALGDHGPATNAIIDAPRGLAFDSAGNLFIADNGDGRIRKVDTNHIITTVAGVGEFDDTSGGSISRFTGDGGPATKAQLAFPEGVTVDSSGNIFIADTDNNRVREVHAGGIINTVLGNGVIGNAGDGGVGTDASLSFPASITISKIGSVLVTESHDLRSLSSQDVVTTIAG